MKIYRRISSWFASTAQEDDSWLSHRQKILYEYTSKLDVHLTKVNDKGRELENLYYILNLKSRYRFQLIYLVKWPPIVVVWDQKSNWTDFSVYIPNRESNEIAKAFVWVNGDTLMIEDLLVYKNYRMIGIGSALLKEITQEALRRNCRSIAGEFKGSEHVIVDRLERFFVRDGFRVTLSPNRDRGECSKVIAT